MSAPKGFKKVATGMSGFWKPTKKGQAVQGVVSGTREAKGEDGKPNVFYLLRLTTPVSSSSGLSSDGKAIKGEVGVLVGVGGQVLKEFCAGRDGREVYLEFVGKAKAKPGRSPAALYDCYDSAEDGE